jgi:hypothetical protein
MRIYRLETAIVDRDGIFHVRVAARLDSALHGTIAQERHCDSRQAAEITEGLLIDRVHAAVRAIGAALDQASAYSDARAAADAHNTDMGVA